MKNEEHFFTNCPAWVGFFEVRSNIEEVISKMSLRDGYKLGVIAYAKCVIRNYGIN